MGTIQDGEVGGGDLESVRVFAQVVKAGGFTAAARALGQPKSTISRRVSQLEARLGVRLLQRTTRKVSLTDVGEVYYARAERALGELSDAERALRDLRDAPRGVLRISAPSDVGHDLLPAIVAAYRSAYPEVGLVVDLDNRRVDLVAEGYDLALRASARLDDSALVARKLTTTEHRLFASREYLARRGVPERPEALSAHDVLLFRSPRLHARLRLRRNTPPPAGAAPNAQDAVDVDLQGPLSSSDLAFLRRAVLEGLGIAALPSFTCSLDLAGGRVQRVLPQWNTGSSSLYAVYPSARYLAPKVRTFVELAAQSLEAIARDGMAAPAPGGP